MKIQAEQKSSIPSDVIMDILSCIPARSVMRFRCVSKSWYSLTHDTYFIDMHLSRAEKLTPALLVEETYAGDLRVHLRIHLHSLVIDNSEFATSKAFATIENKYPVDELSLPCNGLICKKGCESVDVINLTTHESITILKNTRSIGTGIFDTIRLTFHSPTKEYKLVRVYYTRNGSYYSHLPRCTKEYKHRFELLTLGSDSWRFIGDDIIVSGGDYVCVNGTMYFFFIEDQYDVMTPRLMSLDLMDEKFKPVKLPICCEELPNRFRYNLHLLNGNLCLTNIWRGDAFIDIWVLKDQCWSKDYRIGIDGPDTNFDNLRFNMHLCRNPCIP